MAIAQEHILGRELPVEGAVRVAMAHGTDQLLEPGIEGGMLASYIHTGTSVRMSMIQPDVHMHAHSYNLH